ncbi:hypothetical protein GCM10023263_16430 [Phytohabitans rumicis]
MDLDSLWRVLTGGVDVVGPVPPERPGADLLAAAGVGGYLPDIDRFDAEFFGVSPREAREMDPQQRMLLEVSWAAMEHAGIPRERWAGSRTGVYLGVLGMDYALLHARTHGLEGIDGYYASGKEFSFGAGRVAYTFDLRGPCLMLNAACASSLLAVHLATRALVTGECDAALAGGVNLIVGPELSTYMRAIQAMSPRGRCQPFDGRADGIVRSEGCGVVVLKRYADAVAAGDRIWAVIRGSATNHDGRSAGPTAPNAGAQEALLREALEVAGVDPAELDYVEAHSTGTPLGDPIELSALAAAIGSARSPDRPLLVGSHKANFGHLDSAAGIVGLLKAMLVARHGMVPPQIRLDRPTPAFDWAGAGLVVPTVATPLPPRDRPVYAGVSAFGLSGTNVHVVLAAPGAQASEPDAEAPAAALDPVLLVSGPTADAARAQVGAYAERLRDATAEEADALLYSAAVRRTQHAHRLAVAGDRTALLKGLDAYAAGKSAPQVAAGGPAQEHRPALVHVFSGQGSQWSGMALDLYRTSPLVRDTLDECDALVRELGGWSPLEELSRTEGGRLAETRYAQPVNFAVQVALSRLFASWGAGPDAVVGHSAGELAAAHVSGALGLPEATRLAVERGRLMQAATGSGAMVAVELPADEVAPVLARHGADLCVATVNGPRSVVASGPAEPLGRAVEELRAAGATCLPLGVDYAFHSPAVHPYGDALAELLADLAPGPASVRMVSTVDPMADPPALDAAYWGRNVRDPVLFWPAVDRLLAAGPAVFVELGPHPVLQRGLAAAAAARGRRALVVGSLAKRRPAATTLAQTVSRLYAGGVDLDWSAIRGPARRYVPLPPVPLGGDRYWLPDPPPGRRNGSAGPSGPVRAEVRFFDAEGRLLSMVDGPAFGAGPTNGVAAGNGNGNGAAVGNGNGASARPHRNGDAAGDRERVAAVIGRVAAEVLGYPADRRLSPLRGFFDLGMNSLTLVDFVGRLERELGCALGTDAGIEHPTIEALTAHVLAMGARPDPVAAGRATAAARRPTAVAEAGAAEPIAIVGMGCRLPSAAGLDAYWALLTGGVDATTDVPADRWDAAALLAGGRGGPGTVTTRRGAFLDQVDLFDSGFFRVSAREARAMDPQHRLLAEVAWEALEDAGLDAYRLRGGQTAVYAGMNSTDYQHLVTRRMADIDLYYGTGNSFSGAPGRLSYFLGVRGPSLAVDTACSSSLVAVHLAVQSLRAGESDVALAGGVNVMATPTVYLAMSAGGALAPDGRCKAFDEAADGYGRGEGAGVVVLKTLSRARADGDRVYAVIRGSAVNHNGVSAGLTVPSVDAQEELIRSALDAGDVPPAAVEYVEAHGTGTRLGDAAELTALDRALGSGRPADRPLLVGSVKSNIGHLEAAAGVAALIKTALALWHGEIPRHLHFTRPTGQVDWDRLGVRVVTERVPWRSPAGPDRVAGVSAFGFTGTNAHVVLAGVPAPDPAPPAAPARAHLLVASAANEAALVAVRERMRERIAGLPAGELADACHTAGARRTQLEHRVAAVGHTAAELATGLAGGTAHAGVAPAGSTPGFILVYGGSAAVPWAEMDRSEPAFRAALDGIGPEARDALRGGGLAAGDPIAVTAVQIALTDVWRDHGVSPAAVAGSGIGGWAAAHAAGLLGAGEALRGAGGGTVPVPGVVPGVPLWLTAGGESGAPLLVPVDAGRVPAGIAGTALTSTRPWPDAIVDTVAQLYVHGCVVDWDRLIGRRPYRVSLPSYPWQRRPHWISGATPAADDVPAGDEVPAAAAWLLAVPPAQRLDRLLDSVLAAVAAVLGEDSAAAIAPDQGFFELGMDSVLAVALRDRLAEEYAVELPATLTFEFPTSRALARHLLESVAPQAPAPPAEGLAVDPDDDGVDGLSDEDLLNRLMATLAEDG